MKHLFAPHITEKAYAGISEDKKQANTYVFKLRDDVDKTDIKALVEKEFKVTVVGVRIVNLPAKTVRTKGRPGKRSAIKKAIVRLKVGDRIAAFDLAEDTPTEDKN
jgi:large subunit ribosomal protein L23